VDAKLHSQSISWMCGNSHLEWFRSDRITQSCHRPAMTPRIAKRNTGSISPKLAYRGCGYLRFSIGLWINALTGADRTVLNPSPLHFFPIRIDPDLPTHRQSACLARRAGPSRSGRRVPLSPSTQSPQDWPPLFPGGSPGGRESHSEYSRTFQLLRPEPAISDIHPGRFIVKRD